jgi:hypothetical protein
MAVVQISKIQVRRGRKLEVGSVPQLSSAEMAWAVDTQELFIGNGSLTEGAPFVGNTKILTEHDNIIELANSYKFASTDSAIVRSEFRSLQSKLDETVSVFDYGAIPDGSTDCTLAFEAAFEDLFQSTNTTYRKVLLIPNGIYLFNLLDRPLRIPSWASIRGENRNETILNIGNSGIEFVSENGTRPAIPSLFTDSDFPRNISISNLTILHGDGQTEITASRFCEFDSVSWRSDYQLGDVTFVPENANGLYLLPIVEQGGDIRVTGTGVSTPIIQLFSNNYPSTLSSLVGILNADPVFELNFLASVDGNSLKITTLNFLDSASLVEDNFLISAQKDNQASSAVVNPRLTEFQDGSQVVEASVFWNNQSFSTRTTDHVFKNCKFESSRLGIECQQSELFDTEIRFSQCNFNICDTGIYIGGVVPNNGVSQGNRWNIEDCVFEEIANQAFVSTYGIGTRFFRCRFKNCGNGTSTAEFPITSIVKFGEQFNNVLIDCSSNRHQASAITALPLASYPGIVEFENASYASLVDRNFSEIFSSDSARALAVFPILNNYIEIDYTLLLSTHTRKGKITLTIGTDGGNDKIAVYDQYTYSAGTSTSSGGPLLTNFEFSAAAITVGGVKTIVLNYTNPIGDSTITQGTISYSIVYGT